MTLIEVIILAGAHCVSPIRVDGTVTEVNKVPCAVIIRMDQQTGSVQFAPPAAATDPEVIAMLVKPERDAAAAAVAPATDSPGAEGDAPDGIAAVQEPLPAKKQAASAPQKKKIVKNTARLGRAEKAASKRQTARRRDVCGSARAVWYTNKNGRLWGPLRLGKDWTGAPVSLSACRTRSNRSVLCLLTSGWRNRGKVMQEDGFDRRGAVIPTRSAVQGRSFPTREVQDAHQRQAIVEAANAVVPRIKVAEAKGDDRARAPWCSTCAMRPRWRSPAR